jgi:hypothetical protein
MTETTTAITVRPDHIDRNMVVDISKLDRRQLSFLERQQLRQDLIALASKGLDFTQETFKVLGSNEFGVYLLLWIAIHGLERVKFLDALSSGFLKAGVVAHAGISAINPFD